MKYSIMLSKEEGSIIQKKENEKKFNLESCETILTVAREIYQDELDRSKQLESKTAITLAFLGVVITYHLGTFLNNKNVYFSNVKLNTMLFCLDLIITMGFIASIIFLLHAIALSSFKQVRIRDIVNVEDAISDPAQVKINIAATYKIVVEENKTAINSKSQKYAKGLLLTEISFILFIINLLIKGVVNFV